MAQIIDAGPTFGKFLVGADGTYRPYISDPTLGEFVMEPGSTTWSIYTPPVTAPETQPEDEPLDPMKDPSRVPSMKPDENYVWEWDGERWVQRYSAQKAASSEVQRQRQESARDLIGKRLEEYGLSNLSDFIWNLITKENITSEYALVERIRETDQYKTRFPAMKMRRDAGMVAISEQEYVGLERGYQQAMKLAALPSGMFDTSEDFTKLIAGDVSVKELSTRIEGGYQAVAQSNPQVIAEMKRLYGVDDSGIAAYFLDPARATPILLRQARAAQVSAEGALQAGLAVSQAQAEELAVAGVTQESAREGFQRIAQSGELFVPLPGTTEQAISQEEQIGGVFGTQASAQQRIRQRQRERQAVFEAGGRFAGQGTTVTGLQ